MHLRMHSMSRAFTALGGDETVDGFGRETATVSVVKPPVSLAWYDARPSYAPSATWAMGGLPD
jgi:hypothetical protein